MYWGRRQLGTAEVVGWGCPAVHEDVIRTKPTPPSTQNSGTSGVGHPLTAGFVQWTDAKFSHDDLNCTAFAAVLPAPDHSKNGDAELVGFGDDRRSQTF